MSRSLQSPRNAPTSKFNADCPVMAAQAVNYHLLLGPCVLPTSPWPLPYVRGELDKVERARTVD